MEFQTFLEVFQFSISYSQLLFKKFLGMFVSILKSTKKRFGFYIFLKKMSYMASFPIFLCFFKLWHSVKQFSSNILKCSINVFAVSIRFLWLHLFVANCCLCVSFLSCWVGLWVENPVIHVFPRVLKTFINKLFLSTSLDN